MKKYFIPVLITTAFILSACGQTVQKAPAPAPKKTEKPAVSAPVVTNEIAVKPVEPPQEQKPLPVPIKPEPEVEKIHVLILPLKNNSNSKIYANSGLVQSIIYKSFYYFIGVVPSVSLSENTDNPGGLDSVIETAQEKNADFIIYGNYSLTNKKNDPSAMIISRVYSKALGKDVLNKKYKTPTDAELFDTVDAMILDNIEAILNTKVSYSTIAFRQFQTGGEALGIYLNGKFITNVKSDDFSYSMKVLSDTKYLVELKKGDQTVYTADLSLKPGEMSNVGYARPVEKPVLLSSLSGTRWRFEDIHGKVEMTFSPDGSIIYHSDPTTKNNWKQNGNQVTLNINSYSVWTGTIKDGNLMEGNTVNNAGEKWTWKASPVSANYPLSGTRWNFTDLERNSGGILTFNPDGTLIYGPNTNTKNSWKQSGNQVIISINNYSVWTGEIKNVSLIEGDVTNIAGEKWKWNAVPAVVNSLSGTKWHFNDLERNSGGILTFNPDGSLIYGPDTQTDNSWKQNGSQVILNINHYSVWMGEIKNGNLIEGDVTNIAGAKWKWNASPVQ